LLTAMSFINYRIILGKFAYDPRDGEVRFSVDVPIDENTFTYAQFFHSMGVVIKTVEQYTPKLRAIWSGQLTAQQFIEEDIGPELDQLGRALGGFLRDLLEALERETGDSGGSERKRRPDDDDLREV
ncbi:MAG: YbjN domain-containing protein, partial [Fimbriimonadales bacterium]|nr:YbjN domain-containing protein [Fimbriimonadales bacterium]